MTDNGSLDAGAAITGLARLVEALERRVAPLERLPDQIARLAALGSLAAPPAIEPAPTWLAGVHTTVEARALVVSLDEWTRGVFLRYSDTDDFPRECWPWHLDVVEELLWLQAMWLLAYDTPEAKPSAAADWHDRYRPGVVKRICGVKGRGGYASGCTIENHQGGRRQDKPEPTPTDEHTVDLLTDWWTTSRDTTAPDAPTSSRQTPS